MYSLSETRSPVWAAEVWVYQSSGGWRWRADYLCAAQPFATEREARRDAAADTCPSCGVFLCTVEPIHCCEGQRLNPVRGDDHV